jgi:eukaryotic-like serine/threonine-protein kinase
MARRDPFGFTGELIDTQLRVGDPIGEGGFSVVYKGQHLGLDESVAIKCLKLPAGLPPNVMEAIVERFRAESRISYRLSQGNLDIVRSISSGTAHSPKSGVLVPYIALEWLEGPSLSKELKVRRTGGNTGRPLGEVIRVLDPAALALDYAHKQGVIHRDVKPGNLILAKTRDGGERIKVLDFGLAKVIDAAGTGLVPTAQTVAQVILCSPSYGAPEQFDSSLGAISMATDVYSFALIVLELLRDEKVRVTESIGAAAKMALDPKPKGPIQLGLPVSPPIDALFLRALALDPGQRPKDLGEFWSELKELAVAPVTGAAVPIFGATVVTEPPTSALASTAPAVTLPKPPQGGGALPAPAVPTTTQPMARPQTPGAPLAPVGPEPLPFMGTVVMPERPDRRKSVPPMGPITAPMPGVVRPNKEATEAEPSTLDPTRIGTPPVAPQRPAPQPLATPPAASATASTSSSGKVIAVVVFLLLLTSALVVMGGYLAHRWFASRAG